MLFIRIIIIMKKKQWYEEVGKRGEVSGKREEVLGMNLVKDDQEKRKSRKNTQKKLLKTKIKEQLTQHTNRNNTQ
jgi:hypothetical protein